MQNMAASSVKDANSIIIDGKLTRDPLVNTTPKGIRVANFSLAANRYYEHNEKTFKEISFFDVEAWSNLADKMGQFTKDSFIRVLGRLKQDRWQDENGSTRSKVKIVAMHIEPLAGYEAAATAGLQMHVSEKVPVLKTSSDDDDGTEND